MCCDKSSNSFDKSFFSKEEGRELLCSATEIEDSPSLECIEQLDGDNDDEQPNVTTRDLCNSVLDHKSSVIRMARSERFTLSENTLDCVSSIDNTKAEVSWPGSRSEPSLNRRHRSPLSALFQSLHSFTSRRNHSLQWLTRFKLTK